MLMDNHNMENRPDREPVPQQQNQPPQPPQPQQPPVPPVPPLTAAPPHEAAHMAPRPATLPMRRASGHGLDNKAKGLIAAGVIVLIIIVGLCVWFFGLKGYFAAQNATPVYVTPVSSITGVLSDTDPRYSGLVEPQQITKVNKDDSRTVAEVMVHEGDQVYAGDVLFSYDTGETDLAIRQAELEIEGLNNQLTTLQDSKTQLEKEQKDASKDDQFKYTVEIQSVELQINTAEYNRSVKQSELDKLRAALENNQVLSEADGVIQEIHLTPATDSQGQPLPFISILSSGEFRIKGTVTELNINSIMEGQPVTVRSRVDPDSRWTGMIQSIDYEPVQDNNNMYYYDSGSERASKYNFYVTLDSPEGLILGQHVYIEPDTGASASRTGLWLPAMYLTDIGDSGTGYVWARGEDEKLELRPVMLGQYDEGEGLYEIVSGLTASDYIAIPSDDLVVGGPTTTDASAAVPGGDDMMNDPSAGGDGAVFPDGGTDDDFAVDPSTDGTLEDYVEDGGGEGALPDDGTAIMPRGGEDDAGGDVE